jgi:hypothetical protein
MADTDNYKINIKDLALFVRNVQFSPAVRMGHVKALEKTSCKYPIRRVEVNSVNISLDKINPNVVFPSSVQTCFGPSMLSGT